MMRTRTIRTVAWRSLIAMLLVWFSAVGPPTLASPVQNNATGNNNGTGLDLTNASITLNRLNGSVAGSSIAEISPNAALTGSVGNHFVHDIRPTITTGNSGVRFLRVTPPSGWTNVVMLTLEIDGVPWTQACPATTSGEFCPTVSSDVLTVELGSTLGVGTPHITLGFDCDAPPSPQLATLVSEVGDGVAWVISVAGDADGDPLDDNSLTLEAMPGQGVVLQIDKTADRRSAVVGEIVNYTVEVRNTTTTDVTPALLYDQPPRGFRFVSGSMRVDGAPTSLPSSESPLVVDMVMIPAWVDVDGNGGVDPGEPGYQVITYQMVVTTGAVPGSYDNLAVAKDVCDSCLISNESRARVRVRLDPTFDLSTVIGKVFDDLNGDGFQDPGERGVPNAMVALDDGTYAVTDAHGRYHFPAIRPGQRLVKLNRHSLPPGGRATAGDKRVLSVTPGLLVKANFGVRFEWDQEGIGRPGLHGIAVDANHEPLPIEVVGSTRALSVVVNGELLRLQNNDVQLTAGRADDVVRINGGRLDNPLNFTWEATSPDVQGWRLEIVDTDGSAVRMLEADGTLPPQIDWDGRAESGELVQGGRVYRYRMTLRYPDGAESASPWRSFGVNEASFISLALTGEAFESGSDVLSQRAREVLRDAATILRRFPDQRVIIAGHTDSEGSAESNVGLSRRRAESAKRELVEVHGLPAGQFVVEAHGETSPIAGNLLPEGRELNRRVEIRAEVTETEEAELTEQYREPPSVRLAGREVEVGETGRFAAWIEDEGAAALEIELSDRHSREVRTTVALPSLQVDAPATAGMVGVDQEQNGCRLEGGKVHCLLSGRTDPGNRVEFDGEPLPIDVEGRFARDVALAPGDNIFGLVAINSANITRMINVTVEVSETDAEGRRWVVRDPIPMLFVNLPPSGEKLNVNTLRIEGRTDPVNRIEVNDTALPVSADGSFAGVVELPAGPSKLTVKAIDPDGHEGVIERDVDVSRHQLFMLGFAEGTISQMKTSGSLAAADDEDLFVDGRVAFYLKGRVSGRYLLTAAVDTGTGGYGDLFGDLDAEEAERLLTHLDPDRYYPVYGDDSTVVHDVESRSGYYLALDGETIRATLGNFAVAWNDTELASYQRTTHGGRFEYRSAAKSEDGVPDTQLAVFVADAERIHVRDELRATGGSFYYLSHRDVTEGSVQVQLLVRDKLSGLVLSRLPQRRDVDYRVKYEEGRLIFSRPISSAQAGGPLVDDTVFSGNPVYVQVDYETRVDGFSETSAGARVRQRIGPAAIGATAIQDQNTGGSYELAAVDAELNVGKSAKLRAEFADSSGADAARFVSEDGGLTFSPLSTDATAEGSAWKISAELDIGAWFGQSGRHQVNVFRKSVDAGFASNGSHRDEGIERSGIRGRFKLSDAQEILLRHDLEERPTGVIAMTGNDELRQTTLGWSIKRQRWGADVEHFSSLLSGPGGQTLAESTIAAVRAWYRVAERLQLALQQQHTLDGLATDRSTLEVRFQPIDRLHLEARVSDGDRGQATEIGAALTLGESRVYVTERIAEDSVGRRTSTVMGTRLPAGEGGELYSEYRIEDSNAGEQRVRAIGLQKLWELGTGFQVQVSGETAQTEAAAGGGDRTALSANLSYTDGDGLTAATRQEIRRDRGTANRTQFLSVNKLDYRIGTDLTMKLRFRYGKTTDDATNQAEARLEERTFGFAYRPVKNDRFNSLAKYTRVFDLRPLTPSNPVGNERVTDVISMETAYRLNKRIEWFGKLAARDRSERSAGLPAVDTRTDLVIQRFNFRLPHELVLGTEFRMMRQRGLNNQRQGWLGELAYPVKDWMRFGFGYNFTDFSDDVLILDDYSTHGWFLRVQGMY